MQGEEWWRRVQDQDNKSKIKSKPSSKKILRSSRVQN